MIYRRHSKLIFPSGMISLAVLLVLCLLKIKDIYIVRTTPYYCIDLFFPPKEMADTLNGGKKISEIRQYHVYVLSKDASHNHAVLSDARNTINKIKVTRDTLHGIHIMFNDSTPYRDYITAINFSDEKFPGVFYSNKNDFRAWYARIDTADMPKESLERWRKKYGVLY